MTARRDTRLRILDDLSLLFVGGNFDGKDAVAVTPLVDNNGITFETMHAAADEGRLDVVGTATESHVLPNVLVIYAVLPLMQNLTGIQLQEALGKAYRRLAPSSKTLFSTVWNGE